MYDMYQALIYLTAKTRQNFEAKSLMGSGSFNQDIHNLTMSGGNNASVCPLVGCTFWFVCIPIHPSIHVSIYAYMFINSGCHDNIRMHQEDSMHHAWNFGSLRTCCSTVKYFWKFQSCRSNVKITPLSNTGDKFIRSYKDTLYHVTL